MDRHNAFFYLFLFGLLCVCTFIGIKLAVGTLLFFAALFGYV